MVEPGRCWTDCKNNIDISSDSASSPGFIDIAAITEGDHLTQRAFESQGEAPDLHEHELVDEEPQVNVPCLLNFKN